jgi:hypothetical protein
MGLIETLLTQVGPWGWWIIGLVLLGLEVLMAGTFFLWFGVAALVIGTLAFVLPLSWEIQIIAWLALSLIALFFGKRYFKGTDPNPDPTLNNRLARYIGRSFTLTEPILENAGKLKIDDTIWRITGPDLPAGTKVKVVEAQGPVLLVERAEG